LIFDGRTGAHRAAGIRSVSLVLGVHGASGAYVVVGGGIHGGLVVLRN